MQYDLEKILPHSKPMILIDKIIEVNTENKIVIAEVTITEDKIFYDKSINGISNLCAIEYMAQTAGCYAYFKRKGIKANIQNYIEEKPKIGFLLGTRSLKTNIEKFELGKTYQIKVNEIYGDNELVSFKCLIYNDEKECASAIINAFQPENAEQFLIEG